MKIKLFTKANEVQSRFFGQLGTEWEAYIMTECVDQLAIPTAWNDNGSPAVDFTDVQFTRQKIQHDAEMFVDITATAKDNIGNIYLKIVDWA